MKFWLPCWKTFAENLKKFRLKCEIQLEKCFFQRKCFPGKQSCWTRRVQFWQTSQENFAWSPKKKHKSDWKTWKPMKFRLPCWKRFAQNLKSFRLKCGKQMEKCFLQRRCFPWKRSCGHIECSSDRRVYKKLRKVRKKVGIYSIKNLESNAVLITVLENFCRKAEKSLSKMRNIFWKLFFFQRRCFLWKQKQSCGHVECSSNRPANKTLRKVRKKLA